MLTIDNKPFGVGAMTSNAPKGKKKSVSFSLSDEELQGFLERANAHGFSDRNDYVLALLEADLALRLAPVFDRKDRRLVLRPGGKLK